MKNSRKALVLGGGGISGIGWEIGLLTGLAELGLPLSTADVVVGTSAGSVVGAQLTSGAALPDLFAEQIREPTGEISTRLGVRVVFRYVLANLLPGGDQRARARIGKWALAASTVTEAERRAVIAQRVPQQEWPERSLLIPAVEAGTGEVAVFDRDSGVPLMEAVAASCAVPLVWPTITINGKSYIDGGMRSPANADLAAGCDRVVVLAPIQTAFRRSGQIAAQLAGLGPKVHSTIVGPDADSRKTMGRNALDPAYRAAAAWAGYHQATAVRDRVAVAWGLPPA